MMFKVSELIAIIDIVVNAILIIGLGIIIQKNQINSRSLKDYFMNEVVKLHSDIIVFLDELEKPIMPKDVEKKFVVNISKLNTITKIIDNRYSMDSNEIVRDFIKLQTQIENDNHYISNYLGNNLTSLTYNTASDVSQFRSTKLKLFHEVVVKVNDHSNLIF
ncbi:hypothetical protein [Adhaeribacter radiodurans]|uniref:LemA family protein n=1 Tax=Adhaeribacter radiodurans TaxID=2745197 RepID=A0A7L7L7R6_9BACT|nr:hypothetical protein [Adhaeribacter radiodurans]QMU28837.1 hypothetical protein HUW48_12665 [Adhaeribacter radiodurans]